MTVQNKRSADREAGKVLTPTQVANLLQLSVKTVVRHFETGRIPAVKLGVKWRCSRTAIDKLIPQG